jgi:hypothetical protein
MQRITAVTGSNTIVQSSTFGPSSLHHRNRCVAVSKLTEMLLLTIYTDTCPPALTLFIPISTIGAGLQNTPAGTR